MALPDNSHIASQNRSNLLCKIPKNRSRLPFSRPFRTIWPFASLIIDICSMRNILIASFCLLALASCRKNPSCSDGLLNGSEIRIDCGGSCEPCPSCFDGVQNQDETSVDCGGTCEACPPVWEAMNLGVNVRLNDVAFFDEQTGIVVGDNGTLLRTSNGGDTWESLTQTQENLYAIHIRGDKAFVSGRSVLLVGNSRGASWSLKNAPVNHWRDIWFIDDQNGVMVGDSLWVIRTTDGGDSWESELRDFFDPTPLGAVSFLSDQGGSAGGDSRLFITSNGGRSWSMSSTNADSIGGIGNITDLVMLNSNRTIAVAAEGMFISNNNLEWLNKGYSIRNGSLDYLQDEWLYAGTDPSGSVAAVMSSEDGGVSWIDENFPSGAPAQYGADIVTNEVAYMVGASGSAFKRTPAE